MDDKCSKCNDPDVGGEVSDETPGVKLRISSGLCIDSAQIIHIIRSQNA